MTPWNTVTGPVTTFTEQTPFGKSFVISGWSELYFLEWPLKLTFEKQVIVAIFFRVKLLGGMKVPYSLEITPPLLAG